MTVGVRGEDILLYDSSFNGSLSLSLELQLTQLYGETWADDLSTIFSAATGEKQMWPLHCCCSISPLPQGQPAEDLV